MLSFGAVSKTVCHRVNVYCQNEMKYSAAKLIR